MIILDINILLYAYDSTSSHHTKARKWLEDTFSGETLVGISWQTVVLFSESSPTKGFLEIDSPWRRRRR